MPETTSETPDTPTPIRRLNYLEEISLLARATKTLSMALDSCNKDGDNSSAYQDDLVQGGRIAAPIICLRTAFAMWCSINNVNLGLDEKAARPTGPAQTADARMHLLGNLFPLFGPPPSRREAPEARPPAPETDLSTDESDPGDSEEDESHGAD